MPLDQSNDKRMTKDEMENMREVAKDYTDEGVETLRKLLIEFVPDSHKKEVGDILDGLRKQLWNDIDSATDEIIETVPTEDEGE